MFVCLQTYTFVKRKISVCASLCSEFSEVQTACTCIFLGLRYCLSVVIIMYARFAEVMLNSPVEVERGGGEHVSDRWLYAWSSLDMLLRHSLVTAQPTCIIYTGMSQRDKVTLSQYS